MAGRCRAHRDFGTLAKVEVAQDITVDAAKIQARAGDAAYSAEQATLEAARIFRAAQLPESPGGRNITPGEAAEAFGHLRNAARRTHAISQMLAAVAVLFLTGCTHWPQPILTYTHAATPAQAQARAREWVDSQPGRFVANAATTGSMLPHIHGGPRELLLEEFYTNQPLSLGHVVIFDRDPATPRCLHMISAKRGDWLYLAGTNTRRSDGWHHRSKVLAILREVVTQPAEGTR